MNKRKKKVLITGGKGFIARDIRELLTCEYDLFSFGREELDLLDAVSVEHHLKKGRYDVVVHTATYDAAPKHSVKDPTKVLENNLRMFFNLAKCGKYFSKMIYFGSGAEYSREHWLPRMQESYFDSYVPSDQYGFSKYVMTKYAELSDNIFNLRLFGVFGKYDDWRTRFIANACSCAASGQPIKMEQNRCFDFLYIDDLVKIVSWFIENEPKKHVYNICTGKSIDFKTMAELIIKVSGKKLEIEIEKQGMGQEYSGDNALLRHELKGFKFTPREEAIRDLYKWHEQEYAEK